MAKHRTGRINEEVKKEVSNIIQYDLKDPRITAMVSVTRVNVTKDLRYAKVYVSVFATNKEDEETTFEALKNSSGFIRKEIGKRIKLRYTPEVILEMDNAIEHGMHIESLLNKIKDNGKDDKDNE